MAKIPSLHSDEPQEQKPAQKQEAKPGDKEKQKDPKDEKPAPPPDLFTRATAAATHVFLRTPLQPRIGIVLGSGLGGFAAHLEEATIMPYGEIPYFPKPTVEGHVGQLVVGKIAGVPVAVMQGRLHLYEGFSLPDVTFPTRVLGPAWLQDHHRQQRRGSHQPGLQAGRAGTDL